MKLPSGIELEVCSDIARRQERGISKYGKTVSENPLSLREWLQHAYEECLDQAVYLKRAISEIDSKQPKKIVQMKDGVELPFQESDPSIDMLAIAYPDRAWKPHRSSRTYISHDKSLCEGRPCCVHNPSDHHMKDWPQLYREDTSVTERICPHGVGHPDPDQPWPKDDHRWIHGCDGCCCPPKEQSADLCRCGMTLAHCVQFGRNSKLCWDEPK